MVALAAATVALAASFLPWGTSGQRARTSYELTRVAVRFDLLPPDLEPLAPVWFLLPALVGAAWLTRSMGRSRIAATFCVVVGLLSVVAAALTMISPLVTDAGAVLALGSGGLAGVAGSAHLLLPRTSHDR